MANFLFYKTGKSGMAIAGMTLMWMLFLVLLAEKVLPLVPYSWNFLASKFVNLWIVIKRRPFIYVVANFIIISLVSSSSFTQKFHNLLLKLRSNSTHHNISSLISQASQKLVLPFDDDTCWRRIVNSEETEQFPSLDDQFQVQADELKEEVKKTVSFEPQVVEKREEVLQEELMVEAVEHNGKDDFAGKDNYEREVEEEGEEQDTLDATWKAIMDAKNKGNGPYLKKSGTWTAGDRGGGGGEVEKKGKGKGRLARYKVELKKWRTFSRDVAHEQKEYRDSGGKDCRGREGGLMKKGVGLTYHDELKKRSDAFIARVTQDMRLQRLESDQRFLEMINRGL